jgi:adenylate cyclase
VRKLIAGLALGLGSAAVVLAIGAGGWLDRAEMATYDWRVRLTASSSPANPDIVLVEINDSTVRDLSPVYGRWPWPRVVFADLITYLNRAPAKVIAVDFTFPEEHRNVTFKLGGADGDSWTGEQSDKALVDAVRKANVLLLADAIYAGNQGGDQAVAVPNWQTEFSGLGDAIEERPSIIPPFQSLSDAARGLAHNFLPLDRDGIARRVPPFVRTGDRALPFLGVAAAIAASELKPGDIRVDDDALRMRDTVVPLVSEIAPDPLDAARSHVQRTALVNYRIPAFLPNGTRPFKSYEARHLLVAEDQILSGTVPIVDPAEFKDKIVFVGQTLSGLVDVFQTPFGSNVSGIQLHATIADSILSNRFVHPAGARSQIVATVAAAMLVGLLAGLLPFAPAAAAAAVAAAGWTWFSIASFRSGSWVSLAQPLLGMAIALFAGTAYQYFVEDREKRKVKRLFGRYVSKDVYDRLIEHPELAELGGGRREMTVLFSDIRGFTSVTEKGNPEELVSQLNEYFTRMVDVVFRHKGTVDKFVGDMVMALFGAPVDDVDHAEHAVAAAVDMVRELGALNEKWAGEGRGWLDIGIGVNSGEMIAGNIGSSSIMSYTVIGDNVNLGSRLESLNKEYRTRIIISDATRTRLTGKYDIRPLGEVVVKGKTRPVSIFEVAVPSPIPAAHEEVKL